MKNRKNILKMPKELITFISELFDSIAPHFAEIVRL